jgi:long-chain acyl-CoA synthetase
MGDLLGGLKGMLVNFVVRKVKKMVPEFSLPGSFRFNDVVSQGSGMTLKPVVRSREDVAFLQYTGGTTGVSKGATLLNRNIIANMLQVEAWMQPAINTHTEEQNNFVCALPLYHIFALTVCNMIGTRTGSCNLLIPNPRDIPGFVKELSTFKFNVFPCLNTLFNALANNPEFAKLDFSTLKISLGGGMATQRPVAERWMALTGSAIVEGYGLSETSPVATCNVATLKGFTGTIGLPVSSTEIAIRDDDGKDVPLGESGEICIRGPQVMAGYWQRPDETANVMTADGFFKSGDVGIMDTDGSTRIVDRKKDMVLVSGFNVYPSEIEEVAMKHPGIMEAAVIGVPDEHSGEVPKIFIVKKDPNLTEQDVQNFLKEQLTGYKRPKYVEFRADLPKTPVGKILRRELRPK